MQKSDVEQVLHVSPSDIAIFVFSPVTTFLPVLYNQLHMWQTSKKQPSEPPNLGHAQRTFGHSMLAQKSPSTTMDRYPSVKQAFIYEDCLLGGVLCRSLVSPHCTHEPHTSAVAK
jgi:hypothetical protein